MGEEKGAQIAGNITGFIADMNVREPGAVCFALLPYTGHFADAGNRGDAQQWLAPGAVSRVSRCPRRQSQKNLPCTLGFDDVGHLERVSRTGAVNMAEQRNPFEFTELASSTTVLCS